MGGVWEFVEVCGGVVVCGDLFFGVGVLCGAGVAFEIHDGEFVVDVADEVGGAGVSGVVL